MSFEERTLRIERMIGLIDRSNTGTAEELARKLSVSRRTVFHDFDYLRGRGYPVFFSYTTNSYQFEKTPTISNGRYLLHHE